MIGVQGEGFIDKVLLGPIPFNSWNAKTKTRRCVVTSRGCIEAQLISDIQWMTIPWSVEEVCWGSCEAVAIPFALCCPLPVLLGLMSICSILAFKSGAPHKQAYRHGLVLGRYDLYAQGKCTSFDGVVCVLTTLTLSTLPGLLLENSLQPSQRVAVKQYRPKFWSHHSCGRHPS